jgi:ABC-2 type transport system permease protein
MTTLLDVERIKLVSTRSPWWCTALILALAIGVSIPVAIAADQITPTLTQFGTGIGLYVAFVMAALAVTTEYRFGTIRESFVAVPNRVAVLVSKTVLVGVAMGLIGLAAAFAAWAVALPLAGPGGQLALSSASDWRAIAGYGLVYAGYAVIAIGVGMLVRHTAAAIAILLVWALVVQSITGELSVALHANIRGWMPFANAQHFITGSGLLPNGALQDSSVIHYSFGTPWGSFGYFAIVTLAVWVLALITTIRRDA